MDVELPDEPGTQVSEVTVDRPESAYRVRESLLEARVARPRAGTPGAVRGRRLHVDSEDRSGLYVRARPPRGPLRDLAVDATLRAAAFRQQGPREASEAGPLISAQDLREKVRVRRAGSALTFVVDASGSMTRNRRMVETKTAILSLLMSAYTARDRVSLVAFRGNAARVVLPFTASVERARHHLEQLPAGGKTPLAEGLRVGLALTLEERRRHPQAIPLLVVISDGKPNWGRQGRPVAEAERMAWCIRQARVPLLFLDTDATWHEPGMGQTLARITRGRYVGLAELSAEAIVRSVSRTFSAGSAWSGGRPSS